MTEDRHSIAVQRFHLLSDDLTPEITAVFDEYESRNHEFGLQWLRNLAANALPAEETAYLYVARRSPNEFAALPIRLDRHKREAHALSNYYSSLYCPIAQSSSTVPLFAALFRHIARSERLALITLSPLDTESPLFGDLQTALSQAGLRGIHTWRCFINWIHIPVDQSYSTYLESRPSRLKNTIVRKSRKFLADNRGALDIITSEDELANAVEKFQSVYRSSWKREEPHPNFIPQLLQVSASRGWLRLGIASYDGKPVAAQIWLVANGTASIFKLAYSPDHRSLSPGTVLTAYLMQHVIEVDAVTTIDYLTGDDAYKKDWMNELRERHGLAAYNIVSVRGCMAFILHRLKALARRLRSSSPAPLQP